MAERPSVTSSAQVPHLIPYSGYVLDDSGKPIIAPTAVTFAIYQKEQGGPQLWIEIQNVNPDAHGEYSVLLGSSSPNGVPQEVFSTTEARWIGATANGAAEQPRSMLVSVPYALKAGDAETLGGLPASAFLKAGIQATLAAHIPLATNACQTQALRPQATSQSICATGPPGPQGPAGTNGTNGIGFNFRNAFDPSAIYALSDVATYSGSTYVAISANRGPNNITPDKNPAWNLMASAGAPGAIGAAGPVGPQGPPGTASSQGPPAVDGIAGLSSDGANGLKANGQLSSQNVTFFDTFQYADDAINGRVSPTGQAWSVTGFNTSNAQVINHQLQYYPRTNGGAWYAVMNNGSNVRSVSVTFTVNANPGGSATPDASCGPTMAIGVNPANVINQMIHLQYGCGGLNLTWWDGASQSQEPSYHSSKSGAWSATMTTGHTYTITLTWDGGNWVYVTGPNGEVQVFSDTHFAAIGGPAFFVEAGYRTTDYSYPSISNVTATGQGGGIVTDGIVQAPILNGCLGCGTVNPGFVSQLAVGTQNPATGVLMQVVGDTTAGSPDLARLEATNGSAVLRIRADQWGNSQRLLFDDGFGHGAQVYSAGGSAGDLHLVSNAGEQVVFPYNALEADFTGVVKAARYGNPTNATLAAGAAISATGTGYVAPACAASHKCTSSSGTVSFTTGSTMPVTGILLTITDANTHTNLPDCVAHVKLTAPPYTETTSHAFSYATTVATLNVGVELTASTAYTVTYVCMGY